MSTHTETPRDTTVAKMSLPTLTGMVVGSMVGAGVFWLPARFAVATGVLGSLVAWAIAGAGMLMLARSSARSDSGRVVSPSSTCGDTRALDTKGPT